MGTLQIEIRNGKIFSHKGVDVEVMDDTHIEGNGWVGDIDEKGDLAFIATKFYNGERHQLKFRIKEGYVKKLLKIGDCRPRVLKSYKIKERPVNCIIGLSNGYIDNRVCYFRKSSFQKFLDEYEITEFRHESPNTIYRLISEHNGHTLILNEEIETDGNSKLLPAPSGWDEKSELGENTMLYMMEVVGASWVIKTVWKNRQVKHRILYTLDNPQEIVGLTKPEFHICE